MRILAILMALGAALVFASGASALPLVVAHADVPNCDTLLVPHAVHELGTAPTFTTLPTELITSGLGTTELVACTGSDSPDSANALVVITNTTGIAWSDLWYVADSFDSSSGVGTSISNLDGFVDVVGFPSPGEAFKIDAVGVNRPLVFESLLANGIFEIGETWHFVIDDYANSGGLAASLLDSLGVASSSAGGPPSSGSIIAVAVPEPGVALLGLMALATSAALRRRAASSGPR